MPLPDKIITEKPVPVLIGDNYEHIMGFARIVQTPDNATITITINGLEDGRGRILGDFLTASEIVALSFAGVPVRPRPEGV